MDTYSIIVAVIQSTATILTVYFAFQTVKVAHASNQSQAFLFIVQHIQDEDVRSARKTVLEHYDNDSELLENEYGAASKACHTYDTLGILVKHNLVPIQLAAHWSSSIIRIWRKSQPMISERRGRAGQKEWCALEWLVSELEKDPSNLPPSA